MTADDAPQFEEPFDLYSTQIDADPFPGYARLRDHHPCYWSKKGRIWILSRHEDVSHATQNWQVFSSLGGNLVDEIPGRAGGTLGTTDPPRHDRLRALAQGAFLKRNINHLIEPTVTVANKSIDDILQKKSFDFVADFSSQVTVDIMFRMLGLPEQNPAEMRNRVVLSISTDKEKCGRTKVHDEAFDQLSQFMEKEIAHRRKHPQDDLVTHLAEAEIDGDRLSEHEVLMTTSSFLIAGIESLSSFMSIFALNLENFPDARRVLVEQPDMMLPAIEESLRYNTSAQRFKRVLTCDHEMHGQTMHKGDTVVLAYGAANRDERKFPKADIYDINRRPQGHLGFGAGKHFCAGAQFARLVTQTAMDCFLARVPDYALKNEPFDWVPSSNFRSPMTLPFQVM